MPTTKPMTVRLTSAPKITSNKPIAFLNGLKDRASTTKKITTNNPNNVEVFIQNIIR